MGLCHPKMSGSDSDYEMCPSAQSYQTCCCLPTMTGCTCRAPKYPAGARRAVPSDVIPEQLLDRQQRPRSRHTAVCDPRRARGIKVDRNHSPKKRNTYWGMPTGFSGEGGRMVTTKLMVLHPTGGLSSNDSILGAYLN